MGTRTRLAVVAAMLLALPQAPLDAQPEPATRSFRAARALALQGQPEQAVAGFQRAAVEAKASGDAAVEVAARRGVADLLAMRRPCTDSAELTLREALRAADTGDRSASDALVRLLAARGNVTAARQILVAAYSDVPSVGRSVTSESVRFLQGQATLQFAGGQESAALSTLGDALGIAARLHEGDTRDSVPHPSGAVDRINAWVLFDLAMLRLNAKSPSIRQARTAATILDRLVSAPADVLDGGDSEAYPVTRLDDRLLLQAHARGAMPAARSGC
ncbi:MAG: hypothetical protein V4617_10285 [Gemmatimonadota bacterium]